MIYPAWRPEVWSRIMNARIIFRLVIFFATITMLVAVIGWTAHTSWRRTGELMINFPSSRKSFQIADHWQQTILGLNNMILRYAAYRDSTDWTNFFTASAELGRCSIEPAAQLPTLAVKKFVQSVESR